MFTYFRVVFGVERADKGHAHEGERELGQTRSPNPDPLEPPAIKKHSQISKKDLSIALRFREVHAGHEVPVILVEAKRTGQYRLEVE